MLRQNIDGKPIYSNHLWGKLLNIGEKLRELGYEERPNKPNLFSKPFGTGYIYADVRGDRDIPLWEDSGLVVYYYANLPYAYFLQEVMMLIRNGIECRIVHV